MIETDAQIEAIRSAKYLYLGSISEPEDNCLRLVILEATSDLLPNQAIEPLEVMGLPAGPFSEAKPILHGPGCRIFEVVWESYIGYAVQNESFHLPEPKESEGAGRLFVRYTKSTYLDYLAKVTFATADFPGPFVHWRIYCLNHTIEVASMAAPKITISVHR
ncbi:hypothetical protein [Dyella sp. Tek66A03]|uniref:hypothetical protein n=1 Tax=Dyella sp. Tek66A03 TaxID=3458298 RepID=UPI00403EE3B6